jgi:hypothetical protein
MDIYALSVTEEIPTLDHVIVVKLGQQRFEVSGTADCEGSTSTYLRPQLFVTQTEALQQAEEFADAHSLATIYVKGFQPTVG